MKILLDHNIDKRLQQDLSQFEVMRSVEMGWEQKENGELLKRILEHNFDVLITRDTKMKGQQNFDTYSIPVILINVHFNAYKYIKPVVPDIIEALKGKLLPGVVKVPVQMSNVLL